LVEGRYAVVPDGIENDLSDPGAGQIIFEISCNSQTEIKLEADVMAPNGGDNSFFVQFDDESSFEWHIEVTEEFEWREVQQNEERDEWSVVVGAGDHTLIFRKREDGTAIRSVRFLTGNPECAFVDILCEDLNKNCESSQEWKMVPSEEYGCPVDMDHMEINDVDLDDMDIDACKSYAETHGYDHISTQNNKCRPYYETWCDQDETTEDWETHKLTVEKCFAEGSWIAGEVGESCTQACSSAGLVCTEESLYLHNSFVDSPEELGEILSALVPDISFPESGCVQDRSSSNSDVPMFKQTGEICRVSAGDRALSTFSCDRRPGAIKHGRRLCYCELERKETTVWSNMKGFDSVCSKSEHSIEILVDLTLYAVHDNDYTGEDCNTLCGSVGSVCLGGWGDYHNERCFVADGTTRNFECSTRSDESFVCSCAAIISSASKVINYDDCTTIKSVTGPPHKSTDLDIWNTTCPENTAVASVETMDHERHNRFWSIAKIQCCPLVDKITVSQYRKPGGEEFLKGGGTTSVEDQWDVQCDSNGIMVGIYADDDSGDFDDIDATKCNTLDCPYTCGEKIDNHDCVVVNLSPASLSSCPIDYVLVGLWDNVLTAFDRVRKMKCCRVLESILPTVSPTQMPTTDEPSEFPTVSPTTSLPSMNPTVSPTTNNPSEFPTVSPTTSIPSINPTTHEPTLPPSTDRPTKFPTRNPTTDGPTAFPSTPPTYAPSMCEPTCRSHTDQMVNFLDLLLDFNSDLLESVDFRGSDVPLKNTLNEMILGLERLKDQMNIVHDDVMNHAGFGVHWVACGNTKSECPTDNAILANDSELHPVRCVADYNVNGWHSSCSGLYVESDKWQNNAYSRNCVRLNYADAVEFCANEYGRLPTLQEVEDLCVSGSGCGYDQENIWTSTEALMNLGGSGCTASSPCGECQGDCDSDSDCHGGLVCFQRDGLEVVPGCQAGGSGDVSGYDYCHAPAPADPVLRERNAQSIDKLTHLYTQASPSEEETGLTHPITIAFAMIGLFATVSTFLRCGRKKWQYQTIGSEEGL
jgi:hypothetical protein